MVQPAARQELLSAGQGTFAGGLHQVVSLVGRSRQAMRKPAQLGKQRYQLLAEIQISHYAGPHIP